MESVRNVSIVTQKYGNTHVCVCIFAQRKGNMRSACIIAQKVWKTHAQKVRGSARIVCMFAQKVWKMHGAPPFPHMEARCVCTEQCNWGGGGPPRTPTSQGAVRLGLPPEAPPPSCSILPARKNVTGGGPFGCTS